MFLDRDSDDFIVTVDSLARMASALDSGWFRDGSREFRLSGRYLIVRGKRGARIEGVLGIPGNTTYYLSSIDDDSGNHYYVIDTHTL